MRVNKEKMLVAKRQAIFSYHVMGLVVTLSHNGRKTLTHEKLTIVKSTVSFVSVTVMLKRNR